MNIVQQLAIAAHALCAVTDTPHLEAEVLLAHVLNKTRSYLKAYEETILSETTLHIFEGLLKRRLMHEPIAYLIGKKAFWSFELAVNAHTLIPRAETECVIETIMQLFPDRMMPLVMADWGTGSGAIALALSCEYPAAMITALDCDDQAIALAKTNAKTLQITHVTFQQANWHDLPEGCQQYDVIVTNPPYLTQAEWEQTIALSFEPKQALVGGEEGLEEIRHIIRCASSYLKPAGYLVLEHGYTQQPAVRQLLQQAGFQSIFSSKDLLGYDRVMVACYH